MEIGITRTIELRMCAYVYKDISAEPEIERKGKQKFRTPIHNKIGKVILLHF